MTEKPLSPCVRHCTLDADDVCLGCNRTLDEILRWSKLSNPERQQIMNGLADRRLGRARRLGACLSNAHSRR